MGALQKLTGFILGLFKLTVKSVAMLLVWAAIIALFGGIALNNLEQYRELEARRAETLERVAEAEAEADIIRQNRDFIRTDEFAEQQAREILGLVYPDEIIFIRRNATR